MSGKLAGMVWDLDLPHNQAWVLMSLLDHADHDGGKIFPSIELTAWKTGYSRRQVQRIIADLVDAGYLELVCDSGQHRPNEYRAHVDRIPRKPPLVRDKMSPLKQRQGRQNVTPDETPRGDILSARGDILSARGDIAMSPDSMNRHDSDPTTTPLPPTAPMPPGGGGGGGRQDLPAEPPGRPTIHAESARLLADAGIQNTAARNRAAALPPDQVRQVIALAQARPRDKRPGWIARECADRVAAGDLSPTPPAVEVPHVRPARPRAPLPHELEARFRQLEADARRAPAAGDAAD